MTFLLPVKEASRKYTELIKRASSKWANWDPPNLIKAGDYGKINTKTGQFEKEGNIYQDPSIVPLAGQYPPVTAPTVKNYFASSVYARSHEFTADPNNNLAGLANASIKVQWKFSHKRGAILMMHKVQITKVPDEFLQASVGCKSLKGKALVVEVHSCPAYVMYLSNKSNETVKVALQAAVPVIAAPGLSVGAELGTSWWADGFSGHFQEACSFTESFTPLYQIKSICKPGLVRRQSPDPDGQEGEFWADTDVPWGYLNEDGEEEIVTFSDDSD